MVQTFLRKSKSKKEFEELLKSCDFELYKLGSNL